MGQLQCSKFDNDNQFDRMTLDYSNKNDDKNLENRSGSLTQIYAIGKNLNIGNNEKLDKLWDDKVNSFAKYEEQNRKSQNYSNCLGKSFQQSVFEELPLIQEESEYYMYRFFVQEQQEFKRYGLMGIPQKYRWAYWKVITLQKNFKQNNHIEIDQEAKHSIVKDINRTLINEVFREEEARDKLDYVLNQIALIHPKVGYCQGMNYIAALLLTVSGLREKETSQVFASLIHNPFYLLDLLFKNELPLLFLLEEVIMTLIKQKMPKVYQHFQDTETPSSFWLSKILLSGFVYLFGIRDCVLFWDYIFIRGTVLGYTELVLGMLSLYQNDIIQKDQVELADFFSFQDKNCAQDIIKKTIESEKIDSKVIRQIVKGKKQLALQNLFLYFGKPEFDQMYKQIDKS